MNFKLLLQLMNMGLKMVDKIKGCNKCFSVLCDKMICVRIVWDEP